MFHWYCRSKIVEHKHLLLNLLEFDEISKRILEELLVISDVTAEGSKIYWTEMKGFYILTQSSGKK